MTVPEVAAVAVALTGCVVDVRSRRIPNLLSLGSAGVAFCYFLAVGRWAGLGSSVAGWLTAGALFLPFFALGGLGGGDVKLIAAVGAWLGPGQALWLALWAMVAGGPIAFVVAVSRGYLRQAFSNVWGLLMFWRVAGVRPHPGLTLGSAGGPRLPYAVPILIGLMVTLWLGG